MADPHIESPMDWIDHTTVIIYRLGLTLAIPTVALLPWGIDLPIQQLIMLAAAMCASSLHIYMKSFRLLLQMATWVGLVLVILGFPMIGLGGAFITLGGLCFKEYFCFKIPGYHSNPSTGWIVVCYAIWLDNRSKSYRFSLCCSLFDGQRR